MSKWHYVCEEDLVFRDSSIKNGKYYCYHIDVFDRLLNDNNWVHVNHAGDEQDWIMDQLDKMLESNDGTFIFIPTFETAQQIDNHDLLMSMKAEEDFTKEMDWPV